MNRAVSGNLLADFLKSLWEDLSVPGVAWQIVTLLVCVTIGWSFSRGLRAIMRNRQVNFRVVRLGVESFFRVLSPLIALLLVMLAKVFLAQYQQVRLLKLAVPLLMAFALIRLVFYILRRIFARTGHLDPMLLVAEKVFAVFIWVGYALYITGLWPDLTQFLDRTILPVGRYKISLLDIVQAVVSVAITLVLALWIGAWLEERLMRVGSMHSSLRTVVARLVRGTLIAAAILLSLSLVGIDLTMLSVFGGALGVGIGLGLQKIFGSYVSGFVILLERSIAIGDLVTVDKYHGQVIRVSARYTVIRSLSGIETVVPNDLLTSSTVQNYCLTDRRLRLAVQVTIGVASDLEAVLNLLQAVTATVPRVCQEPPPTALLLKLNVDGLELEVGFWIEDLENGQTNVVSEVNRAIWQTLKTHDVPLPFTLKDMNIMPLMPQQSSMTNVV